MRFFLALFVSLLSISCGGGSSITSSPDPESAPTPAPEPPAIECSTMPISIAGATSSDMSTIFPAANSIDGDIASASRWQISGMDRTLTLTLASAETIGSLQVMWYRGDERQYQYAIETSTDNQAWSVQLSNQSSSGRHSGFELIALPEQVSARYIRIVGIGNSSNDDNAIVEVELFNCAEGDSEIIDTFPNELGIDLLDWYISVPTDEDGSGTADNIYEADLAGGYTHSEFFYASADGGIVMQSPSYGFKTSKNTSYVRVELREMLRRGSSEFRTQGVNGNNWVFGSAPAEAQQRAGGVDGRLEVTMAVNEVTTTGENFQIGRVIIGQIHANDDEPIRLYYRKLPNNDLGSIYFAHEIRGRADGSVDKQEDWYEMIGSRSSAASNPSDGIALDERFTYVIETQGNQLFVTISREGKSDVTTSLDMTGSRYDDADQYMYFKVGVYHVNNSSDPSERARATFYSIKNSHTGYDESE